MQEETFKSTQCDQLLAFDGNSHWCLGLGVPGRVTQIRVIQADVICSHYYD